MTLRFVHAISVSVLFTLSTVTMVAQTVGRAPTLPYQPPPPASQSVLDSLLAAKASAIRLRHDDVISITVLGIKELSQEARVREDGSIGYPYLGPLQVEGKSLSEVEHDIASQLVSRHLIHDPQVTVAATTLPSQTVSVTGEVVRAGVFPAFGTQHIGDYIAMAQGLSPTASTTVILRRPSLPEPVVIPLGPDIKTSTYAEIPLFPGDSIQVARIGYVYAVGAFKLQGAYPMKAATPTTVRQLVALAGGVGYEGRRGDAQIVRAQDGKYVMLPVPLNQIMNGKAPDVALLGDDILYVPTNQLRAAVKGGGANLVVSIATSFLYITN